MAASPRLGNSDSIDDRDQSSSQPKRKWNGQQLNIISDGDRHPEREGRDVIEAKSAEKAEIRGRQNSLRHVKNSTEVLRQRSTRRAVKDSAGMDAASGAREGRQFMVANVGNNGRIYLRYAQTVDSGLTTAFNQVLIWCGRQTKCAASSAQHPIATVRLSANHSSK